jgi:uncharacterized membrane protein YfcA
VPNFDFLTDPLFLTAAITALAAALIRGFSGFGSGLVFMPIGAACLGPKTAAGVLFIIDTLLILPFAPRAAQMVEWREILPLGIGAMLMAPIGAMVLFTIDPTPFRWAISLVILISVGALAAGWRYTGPTRTPLSLLVGAIAGFLSGLAQIPGPPVLIYWLGRNIVSATMRANAIIFFLFATVVSGTTFVLGGLFTAEVIARAAVLLPVYGAGIYLGSRMFGWASERTYRRIAYASIIFVAVVSLPVFG